MPMGRFHKSIEIGERFGEWEVREYKGRSSSGHAVYLCSCSCGNTKLVPAVCLRNGSSKSCGCWGKKIRAKAVSKAKTTHGMAKHPLYKIWSGMMDRCYKESCPEYRLYGAKGVTVCERWHDPREFAKDMGERPSRYSIDRIDNNGNYEPSNCRWASQKQQMANVSYNVILSLNGRTMILSDWAKELGITQGALSSRLKSGWDIERALTTPRRKGNFSRGTR